MVLLIEVVAGTPLSKDPGSIAGIAESFLGILSIHAVALELRKLPSVDPFSISRMVRLFCDSSITIRLIFSQPWLKFLAAN